jgi:hypothetical protein
VTESVTAVQLRERCGGRQSPRLTRFGKANQDLQAPSWRSTKVSNGFLDLAQRKGVGDKRFDINSPLADPLQSPAESHV